MERIAEGDYQADFWRYESDDDGYFEYTAAPWSCPAAA